MIALMALTMVAAAPLTVGDGLQCAAGFDGLMTALAQVPGLASARAAPGFSVYEDPRAGTIFTVTNAAHPAHPTLVKRQVVSENGRLAIRMSACGYGARPHFNSLIAEFTALNVGMTASLNRDVRP